MSERRMKIVIAGPWVVGVHDNVILLYIFLEIFLTKL